MFTKAKVRRAALRQFSVLFALCLLLAINSLETEAPSAAPHCATLTAPQADLANTCAR